MKNAKLLLALAGLFVFPVTSQASLQIKLDDGLNSLVVGDNTSKDLSLLTGIDTISQSLDNWVVNVVSSGNLGSTATAPFLTLTSFNVSYTGPGSPTAPLKIFLTDTGYGPTSGFFNLHTGGAQTSSSTITSKFFYDNANIAFAESNQIGTTQVFTSTSYSVDQPAVGHAGTISAPYSLTLEADIANVPSGYYTSQFTSSLTTVPLPATIPLLMSGLAFMGFVGRRAKSA